MPSKYSKVYAFIDSQNLNLGIQSLGWKLDFQKFYIFLKHRKLYERLESYGYKLIFKPTIGNRKKGYKGNIDAELVLYTALVEYPNYDTAIIVSGDGDFFSLYKILEQENKLGRICVPNYKSKSKLLDSFNSYTYMLEQSRGKLEKFGRRGPTSRRL
jgi:uncharacterized LabA/DUF88 family protein